MNATKLKTIAVIAMIIDHIAWAFLPLPSPIAQSMHAVGRMTFPIMSFFIVEGFFHTKDIKAYIKRMGLFATISHIPYQYFSFGRVPLIKPMVGDGPYELFASSVMTTFFIGLIVLWIAHTSKWAKWIKKIAILLVLILTIYSDYSVFGPLLILIYSTHRGNPKEQLISTSLFMIPYILIHLYPPYNESIFIVAILLPNLLLLNYNGKQGKSKNKWVQYSFYIIYPAHLLLLGLLQ